MSEYEQIVRKKTEKLREDYGIGSKCGRSLFSIVESIVLKKSYPINLFRIPFKENNVSGFVGYKNDQFVIFTNTSKSLGYEVFTLAHELYHLLENENEVKQQVAMEESIENRDLCDDVADMFAAELLMPKKVVIDDFNNLLLLNKLEYPDYNLVIQLQQEYYVEYKAITKRLREIGLIENTIEDALNEILSGDLLLSRTKKLGYTNDLNKPSNIVHLPKKFMLAVEKNYENNQISYDDLIVLFSYCAMTPEAFGYRKDDMLSEDALHFLDELNKELERE